MFPGLGESTLHSRLIYFVASPAINPSAIVPSVWCRRAGQCGGTSLLGILIGQFGVDMVEKLHGGGLLMPPPSKESSSFPTVL